jgi:hypothetical protein
VENLTPASGCKTCGRLRQVRSMITMSMCQCFAVLFSVFHRLVVTDLSTESHELAQPVGGGQLK